MQEGISLKKAVGEYKEIYLAYRNFAQRTRVEYINDIEDLIRFLKSAGVQNTGEVTLSNLVRYVAELEKRGFAGSTRKRKVISIRSFFSFLHLEGYIVSDIGKRLIVPFVEVRKPRYLTTDEVGRLLQSAKSNKRDYAIIRVLLHTGIKLSELTRLALDDLQVTSVRDKAGNEVEFIRIKAEGKKKGRALPLNSDTRNAISNYLSVRGKDQSDILFLNNSGKQLGKRGVEKVIEKYFKVVGIKNASVNSLRHTFGFQHLTMGAKTETIQEVMGFTDKHSISMYINLPESST